MGIPLFFFAIWAPVFHNLCRQEEGKRANKDACPIISPVRYELCRLEEGIVSPIFFKASQA